MTLLHGEIRRENINSCFSFGRRCLRRCRRGRMFTASLLTHSREIGEKKRARSTQGLGVEQEKRRCIYLRKKVDLLVSSPCYYLSLRQLTKYRCVSVKRTWTHSCSAVVKVITLLSPFSQWGFSVSEEMRN